MLLLRFLLSNHALELKEQTFFFFYMLEAALEAGASSLVCVCVCVWFCSDVYGTFANHALIVCKLS